MSNYSIYPSAIDGYAQLPLAVDTVTRIDGISVNRLRSAVVNIETELGVNPSTSFENVALRLDSFDTDIDQLDNSLTELLEQVTVLAENCSSGDEIAILEAQLAQAEADLATCGAELDTALDTIAALEAQIDQMYTLSEMLSFRSDG